MAALKRPMSTSSITLRHLKTFVIRNTTAITMVGVIMDGLLILISKTTITTHFETTCLSIVAYNSVSSSAIGLVLLYWCYWWHRVMNCVRIKVSTFQVSGTNGVGKCTASGERVIMVSGMRVWWLHNSRCCYWQVCICYWKPHSDFLLAGFVGFQRAETILIEKVNSIPLLRIK